MALLDVKRVLEREGQLNTIAYIIIILLLAMVLALILPFVTDLSIPDFTLLSNHFVRTLFFGLVLMFIVYMYDQHRRLRARLLKAHERIESANAEITAAYERLSFAQHTATIMTSLCEPNALERVLGNSSEHFGADAAAVVGEDVTLIAGDGVDASRAESAVLQVALDVVRAGKALSTTENAEGGNAIAVPLRVRSELKSVVCLWREGAPFRTDQLEGLILIARIIEMSLENHTLLQEVNEQLAASLAVLSMLVDERMPDHARHSHRLAENAIAVGKSFGMNRKDLADLRISALLCDISLARVAGSVTREHPAESAEIARKACFSPFVQEAVRNHHERLDGSGYPAGSFGDSIPLNARILAVCDDFDAMTAPSPDRTRLAPAQAASALMRGANDLYDAEVVRAFLSVSGHDASPVAERPDPALIEMAAVAALHAPIGAVRIGTGGP